MMKSSAVGARPINCAHPLSFHSARILASVGCTGTHRGTSVFVVLIVPEVGVRVALGARPAQVIRLFLGQGMPLAAVGVALGLAGAFGLSRLLGSLLYGVRPADAPSFVGA